MDRVVIGLPYHPTKRYALDHVFDWLEEQNYPDVEPILRYDTGAYGSADAIKHQFEFFRLHALRCGSDLYIMETDTIPPINAISRLKAHNKDIVGALYRYRSPEKPYVAWPKEAIERGGLVEVDGMGTGAVLLSHNVLGEFSFHDWAAPDCDYPLYDLLRRKGYQVWLDTDLVCKHYINQKEYA